MTEPGARTVAFRLDAGRLWGISLGHLVRCLALASALKPELRPVFLMRAGTEGPALARAEGAAVLELSPDHGDQELADAVEESGAELLVLDMLRPPYGPGLARLRSGGVKLAVLDVLGEYSGPADLLLNDGLACGDKPNPRRDAHAVVLSGPAYFITKNLPAPRPPAPAVREVMLTCGGSDPARLTIALLRSAGQWLGGRTLHVVLGPAFADEAEARALAEALPEVRVHRAPDDFLGLLNRQDAVISAGGRTLYECAALGKPALVVPSIEHELAAAQRMEAAAGFACLGFWEAAASPERLRKALDALEPLPVRQELARRGQALVDGRGLERARRALLGLLEAGGS